MHAFDCETGCSTRVRLRKFRFPRVDHSQLVLSRLTNLFQLANMFIPSDDKVVIKTTESILIYTIPTPAETLGRGPTEWPPTRTISIAWIPSPLRQCSPCVGETSTIIMYVLRGTTTDEIIAFEVPHNISEAQSATCIAEFPSNSTRWQTVGVFDTLSYQTGYSGRRLNLLRYPWDPLSDEGPRSVKFSSHEIDIPPNIASLFNRPSLSAHSFHEAIGRLVMVSVAEDTFYVCDLILARSSKGMDGGRMK